MLRRQKHVLSQSTTPFACTLCLERRETKKIKMSSKGAPSCALNNANQKGRKGAGVKGAGVANCRIFRSAVPSVVVWSILLVSLTVSGVKKKL